MKLNDFSIQLVKYCNWKKAFLGQVCSCQAYNIITKMIVFPYDRLAVLADPEGSQGEQTEKRKKEREWRQKGKKVISLSLIEKKEENQKQSSLQHI